MNRPPTPEELEAIRNGLDESLGAHDAVKQLVALGCEFDRLLTLLALLLRASATDVWTKAELKNAAKFCELAATELRRLTNWGEARNLGLLEDSERWLLERSDDLQLLAAKLREWAPKADKRDNPRLGRARARLVDYARQNAKSPPYVPLAILISVATGKNTDPDTVRKLWRNNADKFAHVLMHN